MRPIACPKLLLMQILINPPPSPRKLLYIIALTLLLPVALSAQNVFTSTQSGDWDDCATWGGSNNPDHGDTVTIAAGHTVTVPAGTFEVGRVIHTDATSRLVMAGSNSVLRYTTTDRGYTAANCCTVLTAADLDVIYFGYDTAANTTREVQNNRMHFSSTDTSWAVVHFRLPSLPAGATFVRWENRPSTIRNQAQYFSTSDPTVAGTFTVTYDFRNTLSSFATGASEVFFHYTYQEGPGCPVITTTSHNFRFVMSDFD